jgi:hypothetical protein
MMVSTCSAASEAVLATELVRAGKVAMSGSLRVWLSFWAKLLAFCSMVVGK